MPTGERQLWTPNEQPPSSGGSWPAGQRAASFGSPGRVYYVCQSPVASRPTARRTCRTKPTGGVQRQIRGVNYTRALIRWLVLCKLSGQTLLAPLVCERKSSALSSRSLQIESLLGWRLVARRARWRCWRPNGAQKSGSPGGRQLDISLAPKWPQVGNVDLGEQLKLTLDFLARMPVSQPASQPG